MKFGVRECADVVLRAKSAQKIGNKIFYKNEPVCYFDTLKTSTFEGAATTVYAQGGRGNARLMSWDGERTVTFTMEDALISPIGLSILTGAGLIEASAGEPITQHIAEVTDVIEGAVTTATENNPAHPLRIYVDQNPTIKKKDGTAVAEPTIYVMVLDGHGEVVSEPYYFKPATSADLGGITLWTDADVTANNCKAEDVGKVKEGTYKGKYPIVLAAGTEFEYPLDAKKATYAGGDDATNSATTNKTSYLLAKAEKVMVDYYTQKTSGAVQIDITPDKFGGTFYLEASTLWRDQGTGKDLPAEFIIPSCKVQSNFSFTLASSGDPSSFTFTMDAFPDYTRWDSTEKVLARIQVIGMNEAGTDEVFRTETWSQYDAGTDGIVTGAEGTALTNN